MSKIVTGLFESPSDAAIAVHSLEARGISPNDISLIAGDGFDREAFGVDSHSKMPEGVAIGATGGAAIGAVLAGLTAVGAIAATGGVGLLAAGPLVAALTGAGAGAVAGSVLGGLVGLGIPEHEIKHYENAIEKGSVLVGVHYHNSEQKKIAKEVFDACSAEKVSHA